MRLADFMERNCEPILAEWVEFARTSGPAGEVMDLTELRDHALDMLHVIIADLRTPQTDEEQAEKSKGKAPTPADGEADTAAEVHGAGRAESGFSVGEMVSEYRALRASVIRLWTAAQGTLTGADLEDLMRFNENIDQSLAESVERYTAGINQSKEMFIAILGHDLRTPLNAVVMASQFMLDAEALTDQQRTMATTILRSGNRMNAMVGDLLDFTRGRFESGLPVAPTEIDLGGVVRQAIDEIRASHPKRLVQFTATGDAHGRWDASRIAQVVTNLLSNAIQYGGSDASVKVTLEGEPDEIALRVHNSGRPIPKGALPGLFSPFKRIAEAGGGTTASDNLGLGLYISERIVTAHHGTISVRSSEDAGTLFTVRLPRRTDASVSQPPVNTQ